jgi:hypothetical protein
MATPLYKHLKDSGSTFYAFPGAAEDLSSAFQNDNYKVRFSKFVLLKLDIPNFKYTEAEGGPYTTDSIQQSILANDEKLINSLRNYVANHEVTIQHSLVNNNTYFYDPNELQTTTERIFWKWLRQVGGVEFEPALPNDEYVDSAEFQVDENLDDDYFKEYVWKERDSTPFRVTNIATTGASTIINGQNVVQYRITTSSSTNLKPKDTIKMTNNGNITLGSGLEPNESREFNIYNVADDPLQESRNNLITINIPVNQSGINWNNFAVVDIELVYDKTIVYVGEVSAVNNTQVQNKAYSEVYAYLPDQNGKTPDILFRIKSDHNYSPGLQYPILPTQDQPEIIGAENFESPIITNPENYPGDQFAQFNQNQKYVNSAGFQDRRRGTFFGIPDETDRTQARVAEAPYVWPEFDDFEIDGMTVDFDVNHYSKMNLPGNESQNFDEFNTKYFNQQPPEDFEFNAVLWFYEVEDTSQLKKETEFNSDVETTETNTTITTITTTETTETSQITETKKATNLYGITFLNGLQDDVFDPVERGIETYKKLVTTDQQDGLSYSFSLNLNFNILSENVIEKYDPAKVYSLFGFDLYTEVMRRLAKTNDKFVEMIQLNNNLQEDVLDLKGLIYTQTDIDTINAQIKSLYDLLNLYSNAQLQTTDTIRVETDSSTSPPNIQLHSIDPGFGEVVQLPVSTLYNEQTNVANPVNVIVPEGKDFMITVINNDQADIQLTGNLNIVLDRDLDYRQSCEILIWPEESKFNKQLTISMKTTVINQALFNQTQGYPLIENIDLPIDTNTNPNEDLESIFERWNTIPNSILIKQVNINQISDSYYLNLEIDPILANTLRLGDVIKIENARIDYADGEFVDFSGQYALSTEITENFEIQVLIDPTLGSLVYDNLEVSTENKKQVPFTMLKQPIDIQFNTGLKITITNVDRESSTLNEKYAINIEKYQKKLINEI